MSAFTVKTDTVRLSVRTKDEAVIEIKLHGEGARPPAGSFEQTIARELTEYLDGGREQFSFSIEPSGTPFQKRVWSELRKIPYGQTASYGEIASRIGNKGAARAVGMANNKNPIPLVIPCHRVIAAGGKLGGFGGGLALKRRLLDLETAIGTSVQ